MLLEINQIGNNYEVIDKKRKSIIFEGSWVNNLNNTSAKFSDSIDGSTFTIKQKFVFPAFWKTYYLVANKEYEIKIKPKNILKGHWQLILNQKNVYDYFLHLGNKSSLFKNSKQVARYINKRVTYLNRNSLNIQANDNESHMILIAFAIFLHLGENNFGNTATLNLGNILFKSRKDDISWKPKSTTDKTLY